MGLGWQLHASDTFFCCRHSLCAHTDPIIATRTCALILLRLQVNIPKTRRTYCKGKDCKKHTQHKVTQYKAGKVRRQPQHNHTRSAY
jgi:hypothetical protein